MKRQLLEHVTARYGIFKDAEKSVRPVKTVLDVGSGIRPQRLVRCKEHICVEPHAEYADILLYHGIKVICATATKALQGIGKVDTIVALDVIEHMTKEEGLDFLAMAADVAKEQVVVFTPLGFMPQEENGEVDAWGYQGQKWQRHRSGWEPSEFKGWQIIADSAFHNRGGRSYGAFFAILG